MFDFQLYDSIFQGKTRVSPCIIIHFSDQKCSITNEIERVIWDAQNKNLFGPFLKETVSVISSDRPLKDDNARFTTVPFLIRLTFQGHRCKSGFAIVARTATIEIMLTVPLNS